MWLKFFALCAFYCAKGISRERQADALNKRTSDRKKQHKYKQLRGHGDDASKALCPLVSTFL